MADYFFDTSVLIAYFKNEDARSGALLEEVLNGRTTAAISAITVAEIWSVKPDNPEAWRYQQAVIQLMETVPVDAAVAQLGGCIRQVHGLRLPDALVVACCQSAGGHFFSKDPHFRRVLDAREIAGEVYA